MDNSPWYFTCSPNTFKGSRRDDILAKKPRICAIASGLYFIHHFWGKEKSAQREKHVKHSMCLSLGKTKRGWGTVTGINGRGGRRGSVRVDRRVLHCSKIVYEMEPGAELPFIGHRQHYSTKMREELEDGQQLREQVTFALKCTVRSSPFSCMLNVCFHIFCYARMRHNLRSQW